MRERPPSLAARPVFDARPDPIMPTPNAVTREDRRRIPSSSTLICPVRTLGFICDRTAARPTCKSSPKFIENECCNDDTDTLLHPLGNHGLRSVDLRLCTTKPAIFTFTTSHDEEGRNVSAPAFHDVDLARPVINRPRDEPEPLPPWPFAPRIRRASRDSPR